MTNDNHKSPVLPTLQHLAKDLTNAPPRSPRERLNGFVVLGRTIDKCRAHLVGKVGEYHYDCPVDKLMFTFKGITGDQLKEQVHKGLSDQQLADWFVATGIQRTPQQIKEWSDELEATRYYDQPAKRGWFVPACEALGLDPKTSTLFDYLLADDKASFRAK